MADKQGPEELQNDIDALKEDLRKVQGDLREIADTMVNMGRSSAEEVRERAQREWESGYEQVQDYIEQKPLHVVLGSFLVGLLVGALFGRK